MTARDAALPKLSPELAHTFAREVLVTETLRIKALSAAATVLVLILTAAYVIAPEVVKNIWHSSKFSIVLLYAIYIPFVIFELLVLRVIWHRIEVGGELQPDWWGQGLATEGGREALRFGFEAHHLERIISVTRPENDVRPERRSGSYISPRGGNEEAFRQRASAAQIASPIARPNR